MVTLHRIIKGQIVAAGVVTASLLLVAPVNLASAQSTQPTTRTTPERAGGFERRGVLDRQQRPGEWRRQQPEATTLPAMTEEERKHVEDFLKAYAPKRYAKIQDLSDERQSKVLDAARLQYRALERLKKEDPQVYDIRLKRLPIMDDLYALGWDLRHGDPKPDATRQKVRQRVRDLIDSRVEELNLRIARTQDRIQKIKANLDHEQANLTSQEAAVQQATNNREALIERGMTAIEMESGAELRDLAAPQPQPNRQPQPRPDGDGKADEQSNTRSASITDENGGAVPPDNAEPPPAEMQ